MNDVKQNVIDIVNGREPANPQRVVVLEPDEIVIKEQMHLSEQQIREALELRLAKPFLKFRMVGTTGGVIGSNQGTMTRLTRNVL